MKELIPDVAAPPQVRRPIPNTIYFPKELREAIPPHSDRVLEFDRVSATTNRSWASSSQTWLRAGGYDTGVARAQLSLLAHETGRLDGQFDIGLDLDSETLRALGRFLIDLADQADAELR